MIREQWFSRLGSIWTTTLFEAFRPRSSIKIEAPPGPIRRYLRHLLACRKLKIHSPRWGAIHACRHAVARHRGTDPRICKRIESLGLKAHLSRLDSNGHRHHRQQRRRDLGVLESMPGVGECIPVSKPYKLVSRDAKEEDSIFGSLRPRETSSSAASTSLSSQALAPWKPRAMPGYR